MSGPQRQAQPQANHPMPALSVNVNKIALLRNARHGQVPSVVGLARVALNAGAHGITVHPRPDERHIRRHDVDDCAALLAEADYAGAEFNIEGNPLLPHLMPILRDVRPTQATLVPDDPNQNTSDHGFDLTNPQTVAELAPIVAELKELGCRVSVFIDPDPAVAAAAPALGCERVELYTERYAQAHGTVHGPRTLERFVETARAAQTAGLGVNAGHDLNLDNLPAFAAAVPNLLEVSIGHALVADALERGMTGAVEAYLAALGRP